MLWRTGVSFRARLAHEDSGDQLAENKIGIVKALAHRSLLTRKTCTRRLWRSETAFQKITSFNFNVISRYTAFNQW